MNLLFDPGRRLGHRHLPASVFRASPAITALNPAVLNCTPARPEHNLLHVDVPSRKTSSVEYAALVPTNTLETMSSQAMLEDAMMAPVSDQARTSDTGKEHELGSLSSKSSPIALPAPKAAALSSSPSDMMRVLPVTFKQDELGGEETKKPMNETDKHANLSEKRPIKHWPPKTGPPRDRKDGNVHTLGEVGTADAHQDAVNSRWYAGYRLKENLPVNAKSYGLSATLSRFRPKVEEGDMSLIQILVCQEDPSHKLQTLEAGWRRAEDHKEVTLFIFFTTNDYGDEGLGLGGYVDPDDMKGYELLKKEPGNTYRPGKTFLPASHVGGAQLTLTLQWQLVKNVPKRPNGWYLSINGIYNGFFPLRFFEKGVHDKTKCLADHASSIDVYGEVFDKDYNRALDAPPLFPWPRTTSDMGSGHWPREGWGKAAFIGNIRRQINPPGQAELWEGADPSVWKSYAGQRAYDPSMYDSMFFPNSNTILGSYCFIGGPGATLAVGKWDDWEEISGISKTHGGPSFDPLAAICMLQRDADLTELFIIGTDGKVYCSFQDRNLDWSGFNSKAEWTKLDFGSSSTPKFDRKGKLAVVAGKGNNADVFGIAKDGKVYTTSRRGQKGWATWKDISNEHKFPSGAPISAVSRFDGQFDAFINAGVAGIFTSHWREAPGEPLEWADWLPLDRGSARFPASAEILVLSRSSLSMNVFLTNTKGHVYVSAFRDGLNPPWSQFGDIGTSAPDSTVDPPRPTKFASGSKVGGLAAGPDRMDLFAVATDHKLYTCTWKIGEEWSGIGNGRHWRSLGFATDAAGNKMFDAASSDVVAVRRRTSMDMDVFVTGKKGQIFRTHWTALTDTWTSAFANLNWGWDSGPGASGPGGTNKVTHDLGFRVGATSRNPATLTVVAINHQGTAMATEYSGVPGLP
jgi:hypothetical protein